MDRFARIGRALAGPTALIGILLGPGAVPPATAGSPVGEFEYRFPCELRSGPVRIDYTERVNAAVGLEFFRGQPVLQVNERLSLEQPYEVVAFEYFSACSMAQGIAEPTFRELSRDRGLAETLLRDSDCEALSRLEAEGVVRGSHGYQTILEYYQFWRASESYLGISYAERADLIARSCPR